MTNPIHAEPFAGREDVSLPAHAADLRARRHREAGSAMEPAKSRETIMTAAKLPSRALPRSHNAPEVWIVSPQINSVNLVNGVVPGRESTPSALPICAVPTSLLGGIGLDLMAASPDPHEQPNLGKGDRAPRYHRAACRVLLTASSVWLGRGRLPLMPKR